jgi:hypothetical protein
MRFAVVKDNMVVTVIIANEEQQSELEAALQSELVDASEYNLTVGDLWNGVAWTRNEDGEQVEIEPVVPIEDRVSAVESALTALAIGEE